MTLTQHERHTFTPEEASRGGQAAAIVKRETMGETARRALALRELANATNTIDMPDALIGTALVMLEHAFAGELPPIRSQLDQLRAMQCVDLAVKLARLLRGESTSNTATLNVDLAALRERFDTLEAESHPA